MLVLNRLSHSKMSVNSYYFDIISVGSVMVFVMLWFTVPAYSGAFQFAGDTHGPDVVSHPSGYTGVGGNLRVTVGISPSSPFAAEMEVPLQNAIDTWNRLIPTTGNVKTGEGDFVKPQFDFESVALHELGHCVGLSHPNLASESGLLAAEKNYTRSTKGANNKFDLNSGADGTIGSGDDVRGDDVNLHWFRMADNNPFVVDDVVDSRTYSRDLSDLPMGDSFAANGDRDVSALFGLQKTEAVMQQGIASGETRRSLSADDVATLRLAMSGIDLLAGTADDYTLTMQYVGFTDAADIVLAFDNLASFSACTLSGVFLNKRRDHFTIQAASISFNDGFSWFFNEELKPPASDFPTVAIFVNNVSDLLTLTQGDDLSLDVVLDPGLSVGVQADYWVRANTPMGTFWLDDQLQFILSDTPIRVFGGTLINLPSFNIFNSDTRGLPPGTYTVTFAVDNNRDGVFDGTFHDAVSFIINP